MAHYAKPWLTIDEQIDRLVERGVIIPNRSDAQALLRSIGYYRLTGYLYPFRKSETFRDEVGNDRLRVLSTYREATTIGNAAALIDFDRTLRLLTLDAVERIETTLRTRIGYTIGKVDAFAHEDPSIFIDSFTRAGTAGPDGSPLPSRHEAWLSRVEQRRNSSDEAFVMHFRLKYDNRMPIWALTELLELGHLSRLYAGLRNDLATSIAEEFGVPTKRLLDSWIATTNYVRNVAAHHARFFNRKLVVAPKRPKPDQVPLLAHLGSVRAPKQFGSYNALAVMAYLMRVIEPNGDWPRRLAAHLRAFPSGKHIDQGSMGIAAGWLESDLWNN